MSSHASSPRRPNIDVATAAHAVIAALPAIAAYRERAARLPEFDVRDFDTLATTATSALEASHYLDDLRTRADLCVDPRNSLAASLRVECDALRALLPTEPVDQSPARLLMLIGTGLTHKELVREVQDVCAVVALHLTFTNALGPEEEARLHRVRDLASQLVALDRQDSSNVSAGAQCRDTAFARLVTQYTEVRRAIEYLRPREIELNAIAPSLYEKHGLRSAKRSA